ncbi:MAG TPA: hypothetical protein VED17_08425 [Nitrososphaerales archaeon]|nr:hypothetical protein [Nitrososphaerales archaeon]
MCEHLEIEEFGTYVISNGKEKERIATLLKCGSCKKFLTLDSQEIAKERISERTSFPREKMRTITVNLNDDIYERINALSKRQGADGDFSKIANELLGLGLHHYSRSELK